MEKTPTFRVQPFGHYYLLQRIAVGGMAEIFKAKQIGVRGFEKIVVIKKILSHLSEDPEFVEMFEDEAKIAAQLTQANIVQIYELGETEGTLYITMEYIDGKNMRDVTRSAAQRGIHLTVEQTVFMMMEVLRGLDYAHRKLDSMGTPLTIVHRDMSPQNIIISYEGEVKILDFGIAKAASKISKTEAGVLKGKFSYMSPEQASGRPIDQTSDVYSCGVILHELLTSERLFRAKSDMETLERVKEGKVAPPSDRNPDVLPGLDRIVLKALAKDQSLRYRAASEMLMDLNRFSHENKFSHSSQEISAFMKTLFAETINAEKDHLLRALSQVPATPPDGLQNAKTHIAFKRNPTAGGNEDSNSSSKGKGESTQTTEGKRGSALARALRLASVALFLVAAALFFFSPRWKQKKTPDENPPTMTEVLNDNLNHPTPPADTPPLPQNVLEDLKNSNNPSGTPEKIAAPERRPEPEAESSANHAPLPVPHKVVPPKKTVAPKKAATSKAHPAPIHKKAGNSMAAESHRSAPWERPLKPSRPAPKEVPKEVGSGVIDVIAPMEGFAQLFINQKAMGTVPGPKARGISLSAGKHSVRCQTPTRSYQGSIDVKANQRATIRCQELR